jgi:serine/threonine protein kinase
MADKTPAQRLLGMTLANGWKVIEELPKLPGATGGHFSHGYVVEKKDGQRGFLKALDYSKALELPDPAPVLQALTAAYIFERDLLHKCREKRLNRIVMPLDDGSVKVNGATAAGPVQYIIFELGAGDIRHHIKFAGDLDLAWTLRCLHHVAVGLHQLHGQGIAHQDLKPSNVMVFKGTGSKVADLGRAAAKGQSPPYEDLEVPGDPSYAPPELLYGLCSPDWNQRRFGCDAYLLGSMIVFFFTGTGMTSVLFAELDPLCHWTSWQGTYEEVLPYVREAFNRSLETLSQSINPEVREPITTIVRQLCEPDPDYRGHPKSQSTLGNPYSLERYVSTLDLVARRVEYQHLIIQRAHSV